MPWWLGCYDFLRTSSSAMGLARRSLLTVSCVFFSSETQRWTAPCRASRRRAARWTTSLTTTTWSPKRSTRPWTPRSSSASRSVHFSNFSFLTDVLLFQTGKRISRISFNRYFTFIFNWYWVFTGHWEKREKEFGETRISNFQFLLNHTIRSNKYWISSLPLDYIENWDNQIGWERR